MHGFFSRRRIASVITLALLGLVWMTAVAQAADTPFSVRGTFQIVSIQGMNLVATGEGHASPGGSFDTTVSVHDKGNGYESGVQTLDFGKGDTLTLYIEDQWYPDLRERIGPYVITGGTGKFAGASGSGTFNGFPAGDGTGEFYLDGTISW